MGLLFGLEEELGFVGLDGDADAGADLGVDVGFDVAKERTVVTPRHVLVAAWLLKMLLK